MIAMIIKNNTDNIDDNDNNGIDNDDGNLRNERKYESKEFGEKKKQTRVLFLRQKIREKKNPT